MNNPDTLTVELPGYLLDLLERYVRAGEAYQQTPTDAPGGEFQAALRASKAAAESVAVALEAVLACQAVPGTLGQALAEAARSREAGEPDAE